MTRRENENTKKYSKNQNVAGIMVERNPGVTLVYTTKKFTLVPDHAGKNLFSLSDPISWSWWKEGRPATRAEVQYSIDTGIPLLRAHCFTPDDYNALAQALLENVKYLPAV